MTWKEILEKYEDKLSLGEFIIYLKDEEQQTHINIRSDSKFFGKVVLGKNNDRYVEVDEDSEDMFAIELAPWICIKL